jgi:hypothetical protein
MNSPPHSVPPVFDPELYLAQASAATGVAIPDACRRGVARNLDRIWGFARLLLEMDELAKVEPAPIVDAFEADS